LCRASAGICDVAEFCDGVNDNCPPDSFQPPSTVCRPSGGVCDVVENCTGSGPNCPPDSVAPAFVVCRPTAGVCDDPEACDGVNKACPPDAFEPNGLPCDDTNVCSVNDECQNGVCIGTLDPDACLDDFNCYKEKKLGTQQVFMN